MILLAGFACLSGRTGLSSDSDQGGPCQLFTSIAMNDSITWRSCLEKQIIIKLALGVSSDYTRRINIKSYTLPVVVILTFEIFNLLPDLVWST